jgi:glutathione S-transferase
VRDVELFGLERSVYTRIARLALEEKGVAYDLTEVEIFGSAGVPTEHRRRHPFGRVPVLRHAQFALYETGAITRYVDEAFNGPRLQPSEPAARARMNQTISVLDSYAYRPMVWGVFVERVRKPMTGGNPDERAIADSLAAAETCLAVLDQPAGGSRFLLGDELTLADLHAYPMLRYLALAPEGNELVRKFASLHAWFERMHARPSVTRTRSKYEVAA